MERATHLDPRSPFVLDTLELGRRPGSMRRVQRTVASPGDLGTEVIGVPVGTDVELDLRLEAVVEGVLVSGSVRARAIGECGRCLDEVVDDVDVTVQELFVYPGRAEVAAENGDDEEDLPELDGDLIDVEPVVRDALVTALPFQPLCRVDCPGLCSLCGAHLADDPEHSHETLDPRWAALGGLQSTLDETKES
ncbi:MAG TPA: YceD family protein [Cellulomonas sp.]